MGIEKELIPQFETEEQEGEYWDTHSPLDLAAEPEAQRVRVRGAKNRPITIRLDSESRAKLDRLAAEQGVGPSTFARLILMSAIEHRESLPKGVSLDELKGMLEANLSQSIKERADSLAKAISIGSPDNPTFLLLDKHQMEEWGELGLEAVRILLALENVQIITQKDTKYKEVKTLVQSRT
jgi:antitoxin component of RelBE/YafQ-DinJ toxin-antitoxin module